MKGTSSMPKAPHLKIASANDLMEGNVVYLSRDGRWSEDRRRALASLDPAELETLAGTASRERQVIDIALVDAVLTSNGVPQPTALREVIRDRGPTIRPDLGRQADPALHYGGTIDGSAYHV